MSAVFLKILNLSITASWLILAVVLVRFLLKKAPKWISCVLWVLVAIRLICPFSLESVLSLIPSSETIPSNIEMMQKPAIDSGITVINETVNPVISNSFTPDPLTSANPLQIIIPVLTIVWIVGMAAMLLYAFISYIKLKKSVGASVPVKDNIFACDEVKSPFILGIIKPLIYVPSSMDGATLDYVITHESAHIQRRDHWWKPFGFLLLAVYWFNPLCWLAYVLLCRDIEMACDEKVIHDMDKGSVAEYSQALLDCSFPRRKIAACPLAFGEVGVKERVKSVLNYKKPAFWIIVIAIVACVAVAVCFLTNPKVEVGTAEKLSDEQGLSAIKNYCYSINPDLESIVNDGKYTVYWEIVSSEDEELVVLFRSYTGAQKRFYIDRATGDTYVTEYVPGINSEEQRAEERFNIYAENPSIEAVLMRFEGVWSINNESVFAVERIENSDFTPDNFTQGEEWVIWFSHGSVLTDKQAISHTASSITFQTNDGFYRVEENIAGKLDVFFGSTTDSMDLIFTTAETVEVKIPGTWQTASMVLGADGDISPEHYVQFTDSSINYGHMKDGEFVLDYSDKITRLEKNAADGFIVRAEATNGVQYTYQTSENDNDILEYYETWQEDEFPEMYRGGASLSKSR